MCVDGELSQAIIAGHRNFLVGALNCHRDVGGWGAIGVRHIYLWVQGKVDGVQQTQRGGQCSGVGCNLALGLTMRSKGMAGLKNPGVLVKWIW